jgi:hypothetical protein
MIKSLPRRAALVLTGSAVALTAAMLPAQASAVPGWRINATFSGRGEENLVTGVAAVSARNAWSIGATMKTGKKAGFASVIRHWNGQRWSAVALPAKIAKAWDDQAPAEALIAATAGNNVWAFNELFSRTYLRLTAKGWRIGTLPGSDANLVDITAVDALSATDVWAFGEQLNENTGAASPYVVRFNGTKWVGVTMPNDGGIVAAGASSSSSLWALAETEPAGSGSGMASALRQAHGSVRAAVARLTIGHAFSAAAASSGVATVLHWGPKAGWQPAAVQPVLPAGGELTSLLVANGTIWLGGAVPNSKKGTTEMAADWNGKSTAWSVTTLPAAASSAEFSIVRLAGGSRGGIWAEGGNEDGTSPIARLWHLSGRKWSEVKPNFGKGQWALLQLAPVPHSDSVWGVGISEVGTTDSGIIAIDGPTPR